MPFSPRQALRDQGKFDKAAAAYRQAIAIKSNYAEAHSNLGTALAAQGKPDEAVAAYRQAIRIKPDYAEAYSNLGNVLNRQLTLDEAVAAYRQAITIKPGYSKAFSNLLLVLNCHENQRTRTFLPRIENGMNAMASEFSRFTAYTNDCNPARRLRIGYLSPDFHQHPVAFFVEPLLRGHDRQKVEVFAMLTWWVPILLRRICRGLPITGW